MVHCDIASNSAASCSWRIVESAELELLMASAIDLQAQIMVVEAHCEMADSHYVASLRAAFSAWMELQREWAGECYLSMKSLRLRTTKPAPPDTNVSRTEQSV